MSNSRESDAERRARLLQTQEQMRQMYMSLPAEERRQRAERLAEEMRFQRERRFRNDLAELRDELGDTFDWRRFDSYEPDDQRSIVEDLRFKMDRRNANPQVYGKINRLVAKMTPANINKVIRNLRELRRDDPDEPEGQLVRSAYRDAKREAEEAWLEKADKRQMRRIMKKEMDAMDKEAAEDEEDEQSGYGYARRGGGLIGDIAQGVATAANLFGLGEEDKPKRKKSVAKKPAAKKPTRKPAAKKSVAKKPTAKKAGAKKPTRKPAAKKPAAKKPAAKKISAKKAGAKPAAKRSATKKPARKPAAKRSKK